MPVTFSHNDINYVRVYDRSLGLEDPTHDRFGLPSSAYIRGITLSLPPSLAELFLDAPTFAGPLCIEIDFISTDGHLDRLQAGQGDISIDEVVGRYRVRGVFRSLGFTIFQTTVNLTAFHVRLASDHADVADREAIGYKLREAVREARL